MRLLPHQLNGDGAATEGIAAPGPPLLELLFDPLLAAQKGQQAAGAALHGGLPDGMEGRPVASAHVFHHHRATAVAAAVDDRRGQIRHAGLELPHPLTIGAAHGGIFPRHEGTLRHLRHQLVHGGGVVSPDHQTGAAAVKGFQHFLGERAAIHPHQFDRLAGGLLDLADDRLQLAAQRRVALAPADVEPKAPFRATPAPARWR